MRFRVQILITDKILKTKKFVYKKNHTYKKCKNKIFLKRVFRILKYNN